MLDRRDARRAAMTLLEYLQDTPITPEGCRAEDEYVIRPEDVPPDALDQLNQLEAAEGPLFGVLPGVEP